MKCPGMPGTVIILPGVICCGAAMLLELREGFAIIACPPLHGALVTSREGLRLARAVLVTASSC